MSERRTALVDCNGVSICIDEWEGEGPPVVFLHATGFSRGCWRPMAEQLADLCRPVAVDLRGHGGSEASGAPYIWSSLADDVAALIAQRWQEPLFIVGHSVGGATAVEIVARYDLPVEQLVLFEPVLREAVAVAPDRSPEPSAMSPLVERTLGRRAVWSDRAEAAAYLRERAPYSSWNDAVYEGWAETGFIEIDGDTHLSCSPEVEASVFVETTGSSAYSLLPDVDCPTWIVRATGDRGMPSTCPPSALDRLSDGTEFIVEGSGHFLPLERPDLVVSALRFALLLRRSA